MKKLLIIISGVCLMLILVACSQSNSSDWYETKEKAIEMGLQKEGTDKSAILSVEAYKEETLVFYEHTNALGVASITESKRGYHWFRGNPYTGFSVSGNLHYTTAGFDYQTETGLNVSILVGKLLDNSIQQIKLTGDGKERQLKIFDDSKLFYAIHQRPYQQLEVVTTEK